MSELGAPRPGAVRVPWASLEVGALVELYNTNAGNYPVVRGIIQRTYPSEDPRLALFVGINGALHHPDDGWVAYRDGTYEEGYQDGLAAGLDG